MTRVNFPQISLRDVIELFDTLYAEWCELSELLGHGTAAAQRRANGSIVD
jgi:hypothetical protein